MDQERFIIDYQGSMILEDASIIGNVESSKDICVDGYIDGNVNCKGQLIINKKGVIGGDVNCEALFLKGKIVGNAYVKHKAVLSASAEIQGSLITSCLEITSGAKIIQGLKLKGLKLNSRFK